MRCQDTMKFCDQFCRYAETAKGDWAGRRSCGTFQVLFCKKQENHVYKNKQCEDYEENT